MPEYTYRREDGSTFSVRQKFSDDPLTVDPESGQPVKRVIQNTGVIFKGSGFYINDSKGASKRNLNGASDKSDATDTGKSETPAATKSSSTKSTSSDSKDSSVPKSKTA